MLDLIHRIYEADESFQRAGLHGEDAALHVADRPPDRPRDAGAARPAGARRRWCGSRERTRRAIYVVAGVLTMVGIFAMRWNVVIGGQLFSKSFLGYTTYKMEFATREGLLPAIVLMILPFVILCVLVRLLPPWTDTQGSGAALSEEATMATDDGTLDTRLRQLEDGSRHGPAAARAGTGERGRRRGDSRWPRTRRSRRGARRSTSTPRWCCRWSDAPSWCSAGRSCSGRSRTRASLPRERGRRAGAPLRRRPGWSRADVGARQRRLSAAFHGAAAVVIGVPLLIEATTRFALLEPCVERGGPRGVLRAGAARVVASRPARLAAVATLVALGRR